jgi:fumarate reductase flavoprotein subunit
MATAQPTAAIRHDSGGSVGTPSVVRAAHLPPDTPHVPVAIVGAGACGLTAALALRDAGIDCVVLERDARPQGSTALSSGFIPAPGTRVQRAAGVVDSPEAFANDIQAKAHGSASPVLVDAYSQAIGPAIDALQSRHGLAFELLDGFLYPGHSVRRMHALPERTGAALVAALERAAEAAGATILTHALVRELWCTPDGARLIGAGWMRPDGSIERVGCGALLLACNGYGGNPEMVREWLPEMREASFAGHVGNDGSAIDWGRELGARCADLGGYQGHGSWAVPQGVLVTWALMMRGGVQLNVCGERFHDETQGYSEAAVHVLAQPGSIAWNVFDDPILALARGFPDFRDAESAGAVRHCADAPALAATIGCDAEALQATLASIAAAVDGPDRFGRRFERPLAPPFHAVKVTGALFHTQGGLDVDARCRVLREDGSAFGNLYAAGGAARGVSGNAVWGYLSGNGLLSAVAGGWIAAHAIAAGPD